MFELIFYIDNYRIASVIINNYKIPVPGTITVYVGDEARAFCYYISIKDLVSNYYIMAESREGGSSK